MRATIERITTEAELATVAAAAAADRHVVLFPTHAIKEAGKVVGYCSVCAMPVVNVWLDSQRVTALDSVRLLEQLETGLRFQGLERYVMPCSADSPFFPVMDRLGFAKLGETVLHSKTLKL